MGDEGVATAQALRALGEDRRLRELGAYVPPLSMLRAFGADRDEVAHSRALARILDPALHRNGSVTLGALMREIASSPGLDGGTAATLRQIAEGPWTRVAVRRERMLIDVVVEVSSARAAVVLGIENKIDAGEQPEQLARYQAALARAYPSRTAVLAFLTPTGRDPTTALQGAAVPVVTLDYGAVLSAVGEAREVSPSGSRDERVLLEFEDHVREDILGEGEDETRDMARKLWRAHGRALRLAMEHRPRLEDVRDEYLGLLQDSFGEEVSLYLWPERGKLKEIKLDLPDWFDRGFPFTFFLYEDGEGRPNVRVLVYRDHFTPHAESLAAWARRVNEAERRTLIDETFKPLDGWRYWRKVLAEEDYPPRAVLEEDAYDSETARAALDAVVDLVELLRPRVQGV